MSQFLRQKKLVNWKEIKHHLSILLAFFTIWVSVWMFLRMIARVGDSWRAVRLGNYVAAWLAIPLFFALVIALGLRHRWLIISLMLLLFLSVYQNQLWALSPAATTPVVTQAHELRVMTFNVHPTNQQMDALAQLILDSQLDVVALQEIKRGAGNDLVAQLAEDFPFVARHKRMMLLSRYPIREFPPLRGLSQGQLVEVHAPMGDVYVWNLHAPTAVQQSVWEMQKRELAIIEQHISKTEGPLLLLGDLNTTDQSENYNIIADHLTDAHAVAGQGLGLTYPDPGALYTLFPATKGKLQWLPPLFRIDYIFVSDHWQVQDTLVITSAGGSDHRPLIATIGFR